MRLKIKNLAKIIDANICIDGITVIAGDNNTGKSTIGKTLDALFNSTVNIENKMENARINLLVERIDNILRQSDIYRKEFGSRHFPRNLVRQIAVRTIDEKEENANKLFVEFCKHYLEVEKEYELIELVEELIEQVKQIQNISEEQLSQNIYTNYFNEIFNGNINSVFSGDNTEISLFVKDAEINLEFANNQCISNKRGIRLVNSTIYIDDPFILDELNQQEDLFGLPFSNLSMNRRNICKKLTINSKEDIEEVSLKQLLVNNRLTKIMNLINEVAPGDVIKQRHYMYRTVENNNLPLNLNSISAGLKSFVILKQLLLNGELKEKDVIVLDEPEIHLHPEWQMKYAEIIVCLQKEFDFSIVVTTHSSHFMEALELYSKKYGISDKGHYYLAKHYNSGTKFLDVTESTGEIYKEMVEPSLSLDVLREEMYSEND